MRRFTVLAILALVVAQVGGSIAIAYTPSTAAADVVVQSCTQARYVAWENNGGGDGIQVCYPVNLSNLYNVAHTQSGYCNAIFTDTHDDWNDCISSIYNYSGTESHRVCAYTGANYSGSRVIIYPNTYASWLWPNAFADTISSIKWDC